MTVEKVRKKSVRKSREDRTSAILQAAREVFEERGYEAATVAEIAERVDVVEGTVLHYFSSKRALVLSVMEAFYTEITTKLVEQLKGILGVRNRLHYVIWSHMAMLRDNSALCAVILRESRNLDRTLTQEVHDKNRLYANVVKEIVNQGIQAGEIRADASPALVRNTIFGTAEHFFWDKMVGNQTVDIKQIADQLTELIYNGISAGQEEINTRSVNQLIGKLNHLLDQSNAADTVKTAK